jgi:hypothetical protein
VFFCKFFVFEHAAIPITLPNGDYCHGVTLVLILFLCTVFVKGMLVNFSFAKVQRKAVVDDFCTGIQATSFIVGDL